MKFTRNFPWPYVFAEGAIIVVSILLAFSIDAWWDGRKDRLEEREILHGLEIEFADLSERLDRWAQFNRTGMSLIEQFLSESVANMSLDQIELALAYAMVVNVLDQGGEIEAVLASGRLEKISDREIRRRLIKWPDWLEDIHTNDLSARSYALLEITPFLSSRGFPNKVCPEEFLVCSGPEEAPDSLVRLAENDEFRAMLINRRMWMRFIAIDHEKAHEEANEILDLIRASLAELEE